MKDITHFIAQLTLEEKASLCSGLNFWYLKGIERLGIPSIMVTDGPHGLRKQAGSAEQVGLHDTVPATCFPTASALAATWNRDLVYQVGQALGEECRQEKVGVILGPGVNIKRSPLCGRNFEYFSEDPYLTGEIAKNHINGVQSQGIGTSLKHYAVNNQEHRRMLIDAVVDERALREIYLAGYEIAVKEAQPWTLMCAYNKVNGTFCCEHRFLMNDILKEEWGHTGLVMTDWGAMNEVVDALIAGVDLEMPGAPNGNAARIVAAVKSGSLDAAVLDRAVGRILTLIFKAEETLSQDYTYDTAAHHALARRAAAEGAVLLKNDGGLLPLPQNGKIALVGGFAKTPRYQGAGSSLMNPSKLDNLHDELVRLVGSENVRFAAGYTPGGDEPDEALIQEAVQLAADADVVVVCAGLTEMYETEGIDRKHMRLPRGHDALIERLAAVHPKVVVVLSNGAPVEMPWIGTVPAVLEGYLGGQAGAGALADILLGKVNPSGKLAETFPLKLQDNPSFPNFPGGPTTVEYRESIYVGYRYYDTVNHEVLFPFGHGLSYTTFAYRDLELIQTKDPEKPLVVTFSIENTGAMAGQEVAQVYVRDVEAGAFRPAQELKGFAKLHLQPGEARQVRIELNRRAFAFYAVDRSEWVVEAGEFEILVGASSRDIRLSAMTTIASEQAPVSTAARDRLAAYYSPVKGAAFSQADFEAVLGRPVPRNQPLKKGEYTLTTALMDMSESFIARQLHNLAKKRIKAIIQGRENTPTAAMIEVSAVEVPLRNMLAYGNGTLTRPMLQGLLDMMNGRYVKGLFAFLKARRERNKKAG